MILPLVTAEFGPTFPWITKNSRQNIKNNYRKALEIEQKQANTGEEVTLGEISFCEIFCILPQVPVSLVGGPINNKKVPLIILLVKRNRGQYLEKLQPLESEEEILGRKEPERATPKFCA